MALLLSSALLAVAPLAAHAEVLGNEESVQILGDDPITVTAALDPQAAQAQLIVSSFKYVPRNQGLEVSFVVASGEVIPTRQVTLQRPLLEDIHITRKDGDVRHIPVVPLDICVGATRMQVDFRLYRRENFKPTMTLGAAQTAELIRRGNILDTSRSFIQTPDCQPAAARS
ncbi:MAG TPA: RimK/LysX family protein [Nevskiaceae bacterium]